MPVLTGGYLGILDPVCLFGVTCTVSEDVSHLRMCCIAKLCVQHQTGEQGRRSFGESGAYLGAGGGLCHELGRAAGRVSKSQAHHGAYCGEIADLLSQVVVIVFFAGYVKQHS